MGDLERSKSTFKPTGMLTALNTQELQYAMKGDPAFVGVFPIDILPKNVNKLKTVKFICNLQPSNLPGSHWVAVYRCEGRGYYMDTFGRIPPPELQHWLATEAKSWDYNRNVIQSETDEIACGYICVYFLSQVS